ETFCAGDADFLPQFTHHRRARVLVFVDTTLRHLPFQPRQNDFRAVIAKSAANQDETVRIEQCDPDSGAIRLLDSHDISVGRADRSAALSVASSSTKFRSVSMLIREGRQGAGLTGQPETDGVMPYSPETSAW